MLGLQSGEKRHVERSASVITGKTTVKRLFGVINPFLFPVGCVEKGFKAQFKYAIIVVEKKIRKKLMDKEKKAKRNFPLVMEQLLEVRKQIN